ncbi:hypothetical protein [Flavivirga spongiicola]|uniref:Regulator of cell morphogenesis and NO signaling n=1 Tax=Flavivirga spongiicola TaxID=421621 RepID=A0ABU7XPB6_9FLAO|nr:hypothetical protein [Flavivirga sp. MEBiC05379]MDO5981423.1 hypothetical protein [Flavivirga sp. MEBiC05379]
MITSYTSPSEITLQHRITEHVFNRFGIDSSNTNQIIENTTLTEINPDFLVDVLNVFCNYEDVDINLFSKYPVPVIVDYLTRSHKYYMEKILPEIGQSIAILLSNYPKSHPLLEILYKFYFKYKVDLQEHFNEEEETLFLYANSLYKAIFFKKEISFFIEFLQKNSIDDFVEEHSDTVENLSDIMNVLLQYEPPKTNKSSFRILLEKLKNFEYDLNIHAFIEDKVLITKLYDLEQNIKLEVNN